MTAVLLLSLLHVCVVYSWPHVQQCEVPAWTESGRVCGAKKQADDGTVYASFRGVPYAKQPVGDLRFKKLEPAESWEPNDYDATKEGPICIQTDVLYGRIMQPQGMSEACIHANIHVPIDAVPHTKPTRSLGHPYQTATSGSPVENTTPKGLPILVFIHGGGFAFGSGDSDLHGPEYLMSKEVIVITFNYRLNVFGFLSLNTEKVPGNAGLWDMVTLLHWVQRNARYFGGDPNEVTLAGQSAGAVSAHLLSLSKVTDGLFKRAILMSGTGIANFFSPSPLYAQYLTKQLLTILGITVTDPEQIYQQLIEMTTEQLANANALLLENIGLVTFVPTIETPIAGVTPILDNDPEVLVAEGRGSNIPLLIGYTDAECETFRRRFEQFKIADKIVENPTLMVPPKTIFSTPSELLLDIAKKIENRYFNDTKNIDNFVHYCTEGLYQYSALKLVEERGKTGGAPVYLYKFSYPGERSVIKQVMGLNFTGAGHIEDLTYVFRTNSVEGTMRSYPPRTLDSSMTDWMTNYVTNFMKNSKTGNLRPMQSSNYIYHQEIGNPISNPRKILSKEQREIIDFFNNLTNKVE